MAALPGRVEYLAGEISEGDLPARPAVVIDTAHNQASARALAEALAELPPHGRRTLIVAASSDKDVMAILQELVPFFDRVVATQYQDNPRAVPADEMAEMVRTAIGQWAPLRVGEVSKFGDAARGVGVRSAEARSRTN